MRRHKGITLIALVITVIILLILAGVTLALIKNGRVVNKSQYAVDKYGYEQAREKLLLCLTDYEFEKILDKNTKLKDKLNEVDDNHNVSEVNDGEDYLVIIDGYVFYVGIDTLKVSDAVDGNTINFPINEPGTYKITVNANEQAKWITLIKINEVIPDGASIEYKFATSNDKINWEEWDSIDAINDANVLSQYLRVTAILTENRTTGECPSIDGLKVKFMINMIEELFEIIDDSSFEAYNDSYRLKEGYDSGIISQQLSLGSPMNAAEIAQRIDYPVITTITNGGNTTSQISSKNIASVYVGNMNSNGSIEWSNISSSSPSTMYSYVRVDVPIAEGQTISKVSLNTKDIDVNVMDIEWQTVKTLYYYIDATSPEGEWLSIEPDETNYENSRIVYTFAKSNDDENYTDYSKQITDNNPSRYLKIRAQIQVRNENVKQYSTINEMNVNYNLKGKKYTTKPLNKDAVWKLVYLYNAVNVEVTSSNNDNTVTKIELKEDEIVESNNATFNISSAGTYELKAFFKDGTISEKYIEVTEEDISTFDIFKYIEVTGKSLADMGISRVSKSNCETLSEVSGKIGGGHHTDNASWSYSFKVLVDQVYEKINFNQMSLTAILWANGNATSYANVTVYYTDGTSSSATTIGSQNNSSSWKTSTINLNVEEGKTVDYLLFKCWGKDTNYYSSQAYITNISFK